MEEQWKESIDGFIQKADEHGVRMLMVGGGAVNFHGYQRHSADVDFWIDTSPENLQKLITVFRAMGYEIDSFPDAVHRQETNISVKFSPIDINLELITRFEIGKSFDQAYAESEKVELKKNTVLRWRVLHYNDLIESKRRAARPKDLLDILQLKEINPDK
jgi:hypothetical protein